MATASASAGTARRRRRRSSRASSRPGTTGTSASSATASAPGSCSRTSARRPAPRSSRPNCHPFRYRNWLWMHNGSIAEFHKVKRDLMLAIDPSLFPDIEGLDRLGDVLLPRAHVRARGRPAGGGRASGRLHRARGQEQRHRVPDPDDRGDERRRQACGRSATRPSASRARSSTRRASTSSAQLHPDNPILHEVSDETRLIVSEPLRDLPGAWNEVPESSYGIVQEGQDEMHPFTPQPPS